METREIIAYTIIAATILLAAVMLTGWSRRRAARRLRMRGIKSQTGR